MAVFCTTNRVDALPSQDNDEPPSSHQRAAATSQSCRKITEPIAAQWRSTLFTLPDVLPPDANCRFTQSEVRSARPKYIAASVIKLSASPRLVHSFAPRVAATFSPVITQSAGIPFTGLFA